VIHRGNNCLTVFLDITLESPWFPLDREDLWPLREKMEREYRKAYEGECASENIEDARLHLFQRRQAPVKQNSKDGK